MTFVCISAGPAYLHNYPKIDSGSFRSAIWFRCAIPIPNPKPIPNRNPNVTVSLTLSQPNAKPDARAKNYLQ